MAFSNETAPYYLKVISELLPEENEKILLAWQEPDERQQGLIQTHDLARRAYSRGWQIWIDDLGITSRMGQKIYSKIFDLKSLFEVLERKGVRRDTVYALLESDLD